MIRRTLLSMALAAGLAVTLGTIPTPARTDPARTDPARTNPADAARFITGLGTQAVQILGDGGSLADRETRIKRLLATNLNLPLIGRFVLGRTWRSATREQQVEYINLFSAFVLNTYAQRLGGYQGQVFTVTATRPIGRQDALVTTLIRRPSGEALEAGWRVRAETGAYKIVDVMVAGVSMAVAQRSEFSTLVKRHGLAGLIDALRAKVTRHAARSS